MRTTFRWPALALAAIAALTIVAGAALAPQAAGARQRLYSVTDLGTFGGATTAFGVDNRGDVVGCSAFSDGQCGHAFLFHGGALSDLGALPGATASVAYAVNERREAVGVSALPGLDFGFPFGHAVLFTGGHVRDLGTLGGPWSLAFAINAPGNVVGGSSVEGAIGQHAFLFVAGTMRDINPPGSGSSVAFGINASGAVVGQAWGSHAFLLKHRQAIDLGTLGGNTSEAKAINARGDVVGGANPPGNRTVHAFLYRHGHLLDLGSLMGGAGLSEALAINDAGLIVGISTTSPPPEAPTDAFLSYGPSAMVDLNDLIPADAGWNLEAATGINNRGQIVGYGIHGGAERAFLLTPTQD